MKLSRVSVIITLVATFAGLVTGVGVYLGRSEHIERQVPGTAAWIPHIVIAVVMAIGLTVIVRRSPLGRKVLLAPLGAPIAGRIAAIFREGAHPVGVLRCLVVGLLVSLEVYMGWRVGEQVFAGLDPNFVRNAWGGPSYLGAMACHYLDGVLLLTVFHGLLLATTVPARRAVAAN